MVYPQLIIPAYLKWMALFCSALLATYAFAQDDDEVFELDPFVVTNTEGYTATNTISATGLNTPLINLPMAINVVTSDFLEDSHIGEFTHALDYNASISQTGRNHNGRTNPQIFAIRGFRNSTMLVDGVLGGAVLPMQMVDRIEVVKGPNTLYGQAEPGGLVNVISKKPSSVQGGKVKAIVGDGAWRQLKLDYTLRAMDDKLGLRVMSDNKEFDGWRLVGGQQHDFKGLSGTYAIADDTEFDFVLAQNQVTGFPTQRATWGFERIATDLNGDGDTDDTVDGIREATARYNNTFLPEDYVSSTAENIMDHDNYWMSLGFRHSFSDNHNLQYKYNFHDLHNITTFREFNTFGTDGVAGGLDALDDFRGRDEVHTLNDTFQFESGGVRHQVLLGVRRSERYNSGGTYRLRATNAAESAIRRELEARTGKVFRDFLSKDEILSGTVRYWEEDVPSLEELRTFGVRSNQNDRSIQEVTTFYATDNIFFNEGKSNVLFGVRHIDLEQRSTLLGGAESGSVSGSDVNFQFGAVHRINPHVSAFGSWADAFRPQNTIDPNTGEFVGPQTSEAIEVGLKFDGVGDGKLSGSVALFSIEQSNVFRSDHNPVTFINDTAITDDLSEGFEFELFYNPVPNWNIVASYSYIDAKVVGEVATGLQLEGATPHRFTLFNSYTVKEGPLEGARFGGGMVFADGPIQQFGNISNSLVTEDGYTTFDLFARFPFNMGDRDFEFGINIDNVTDEFFVRSRAGTSEARQVLFSLSTEL